MRSSPKKVFQLDSSESDEESKLSQEKKQVKPRIMGRNREDFIQNSHKGKTAKVKKGFGLRDIYCNIYIFNQANEMGKQSRQSERNTSVQDESEYSGRISEYGK